MKKILYILCFSTLIVGCGNTSVREAQLLDSNESIVDIMSVPNSLSSGDTIWVGYVSFKYPYIYTSDSSAADNRAVLR